MTAQKAADSLRDIADIELPDSDDVRRRLGDLWQDNPVVFVWLRHYG